MGGFFNTITNAIHDAGNSISNAVNNTVNNVQQAAQNASNSISNAWQGSAAGQAAIHAQDAMADFLNHVKDSAGNMTILALLPFKVAMLNALRNRGIAANKNDSLLKIAVMFQDIVINHKNNFEYHTYERLNHFDIGNAFSGAGDDMGGGGGSGTNSATAAAEQVAAAAVASMGKEAIQKVVKTVSDWISDIGHKRANGTALTAEESQIASDSDAGIAQVGNSLPSGDTDWTPLFVLLGAIATFFLLHKIFKRKKANA